MAIRLLADCPGHVPTLARWHHAEWGGLYADWRLADAEAELAAHAAGSGRATTLVDEHDGVPRGSVSLVEEDAPEFRPLGGPWLASLYVAPPERGRGLGAALVRALVAHAARWRVPRLQLFTPVHAAFYARLGWRETARAALNGTPVTLMEIDPAGAAGA